MLAHPTTWPQRPARWLHVFVLIVGLLAMGSASGADRRIALVIGNSAYRGFVPLRNPANDASDVARRLKDFGFEVTLLLNGTQRQMTRAMTRFGEGVEHETEALFYFAGHAIQAGGRNYLIPVDAEIKSEAAARTEAVDVDRVLAQMVGSRVGIVILDACRNNPYESRFRGAVGGLAHVEAPKGTLIAYATAPGKVAEDGESRNSPYTGALLESLEQPERPIEDVFKQVRAKVVMQTNDRQVPWESSSLTGRFHFAAPAQAADAGLAATAPRSALQIEDELWSAVAAADDPAAYRAYLAEYPSGRYAAAARVRIAMRAQAAASPPVAERSGGDRGAGAGSRPPAVAAVTPTAGAATRYRAEKGRYRLVVRHSGDALLVERFVMVGIGGSLVEFQCRASAFDEKIPLAADQEFVFWCHGDSTVRRARTVRGRFPDFAIESSDFDGGETGLTFVRTD